VATATATEVTTAITVATEVTEAVTDITQGAITEAMDLTAAADMVIGATLLMAVITVAMEVATMEITGTNMEVTVHGAIAAAQDTRRSGAGTALMAPNRRMAPAAEVTEATTTAATPGITVTAPMAVMATLHMAHTETTAAGTRVATAPITAHTVATAATVDITLTVPIKILSENAS